MTRVRRLENADKRSHDHYSSGVSGLDTAGAWLIERLQQRLVAQQEWKCNWKVCVNPGFPLMEEVGRSRRAYPGHPTPEKAVLSYFISGRAGAVALFPWVVVDFKMAMHILGATIPRSPAQIRTRGSGIPFAAVYADGRMGVGQFPSSS